MGYDVSWGWAFGMMAMMSLTLVVAIAAGVWLGATLVRRGDDRKS